ncbi:MAG: hypothetical protein JNK82_24505 [Myxococcaceae bacterium]|nr:hypothetical protein [Myxococcaceae bacterium]
MLVAIVVSAVLGQATPAPAELTPAAVDEQNPAPAPEGAVPKPERPRPIQRGPRSGVVLGTDAFVDWWPYASSSGPNRANQYPQSLLTGVRLTGGYQHKSLLRGLLVLELAYAAARLEMNTGQDGLVLGIGAEGDLVTHDLLVLFGRVTAGWTLTKNMRPGITDRMLSFALGARVLKVVDLHVTLGTDFFGTFSAGVGAAVGWQWLLDL